MLVVPNSRIILLKNPIEMDYANELTFSNATNQYNYFYNLPKLECSNATYQRKDEVVRFPTGGDSSSGVTFEDLLDYNYCMYQNTAFDNKWFYAFVKKVEFDNPGMSYITLETDVWQSWMFDITFKNSFVEREHVNDDTVGSHTIPEDLETGEWICNSHIIDDAMDNILEDMTYVLSTSTDPYATDSSGKLVQRSGGLYNGIYSGTVYFRLDNKTVVNAMLEHIASLGQVDVINGLFIAPKLLASIEVPSDTNGYILNSNSPSTYTNAISKQTTLNGYTPVNKKLLTHLYNYMIVSNNNGSSYVYHYEDFSDSSCNFVIKMALTPGCSIRMTPKNYRGMAEADEYSINMGKLPICSFNCDMYTNWMTQNSINIGGHTITTDDINIGSSLINGFTSGLSNAISGDVSGTLTSGLSGLTNVANAMITKKQHELIPAQTRGNLNGSDVITASNKNNFHFYKMSIRQEYARIIDKYFSMYGYKVNDIKTPNISGRTNWNYVKTIGCNILGNIPQDDMQKIKNMFDNGVTMWHNPSTFLDYSQSNNIV